MAVDPAKFSAIALRIRNIDPHTYEEFLKLLNDYTYDVTVAVTEASSTDILQAQGRAQQARKFYQLLSEVRGQKP